MRSREAPATLPPATAESPSARRRPFGYKIIYHDLGEGSKRQCRIIGKELEPAKADAVREAIRRMLRGESLRSIALDFNGAASSLQEAS